MSGQWELRSETLPHTNKDGLCFSSFWPGVNSKLQCMQATRVPSNLLHAKARLEGREAASKSALEWLLSF